MEAIGYIYPVSPWQGYVIVPDEVEITVECDRIVTTRKHKTSKPDNEMEILLYKEGSLVDEIHLGSYNVSIYVMENGTTMHIDAIGVGTNDTSKLK